MTPPLTDRHQEPLLREVVHSNYSELVSLAAAMREDASCVVGPRLARWMT